MTRPVSNQRLFVAIYPPADALRKHLGLLQTLALPSHRPVPLDQIHLTVHFIGDRPSADLPALIESVSRSVAGLRPFELSPQRLQTLPQKPPARLIALLCDEHPILSEVNGRLVMRCASKPRRSDDRHFLPHLTLSRFASPARDLAIDEAVTGSPWTVDRVALMRSHLHASGARHVQIASFELTG